MIDFQQARAVVQAAHPGEWVAPWGKQDELGFLVVVGDRAAVDPTLWTPEGAELASDVVTIVTNTGELVELSSTEQEVRQRTNRMRPVGAPHPEDWN